MKAKKKQLFAVALLLIIAVAVTIVVVISQKDDVDQDSSDITSAYFSVNLPADSVVTSESSDDNIYVTIAKPYGELRVGISQSSLNVTRRITSGDSRVEDKTVSGVAASQSTVDYSNKIRGNSSKLLIRYGVDVYHIDKPSPELYTDIDITAMSKRPLTSSEKASVERDAAVIIDSLLIK